MILKDEKIIFYVDNRKHTRRQLTYQCDCCGKICVFQGNNLERKAHRKFHFCCVECCKNESKQGGKVRQHIEQTNLEKFGSITPLTNEECKQKSKNTLMTKYGVAHISQVDEIKEKCKQTCLEKFGKTSFLATEENRQLLKTPEINDRRLESFTKVDWVERNHKSHQTMKDNFSYGHSKIEDDFYDFLCKKFNVDDVVRQYSVNGWPIDFYIKSIDTYIQFDGVYWHGLNRPIEQIKEFKCPRDVEIYKKYQFDIKQNHWFKEHKLKLIRITDVQFLQQSDVFDLTQIHLQNYDDSHN